MIMSLLLLLSLLIIHFDYIVLIHGDTLRPDNIECNEQNIKQIDKCTGGKRNTFSMLLVSSCTVAELGVHL